MNQELEFLEKLRVLKATLSVQSKDISDEEIACYFHDQKLNSQQLQMIRDYIADGDEEEEELSEEDVEYLKECEDIYRNIPKLDTTNLEQYQKVINGDRSAYEAVAVQYMEKVLDVAKMHKTEGVFLEDLVSEGLVGLTEGLTMLRYAQTAHQEIMDAIRKRIRLYLMERDVEVSHDNSMIDKVRKMDEALNILKEDLGRKVYIEEVADYMKITEEEVWDILKLTGENVSEDEEPEE